MAEKIGIIGTGSLGLALLSFFKRKGFDIFSYEKDEILKNKIKKNGFEVLFGKRIKFPPFDFCKSFEEFPFEDLKFLIVTVKSYDLEELFSKLPERALKIPIILFQNGLEIEKILKKRNIDLYRFICHLAVYKEKENIIYIRNLKNLNYLGGENSYKGMEIAKIFNQVGIKTLFKKDIKKYIWEKAILNSLLNPLCAIFQKNMKETLKIPGIEFILKNILKESLKVAKAEGINFSKNFEKEALNYIKKGKSHIPSMVFDIKKGRTEIDFLNGKISEIGRKHKIQTPVNDFICFNIKNLINDRNI